MNLRELWHFRELLYFLAWRDVKVRYKQTVLGAAWAILQPASMVVFTIFFGRLAHVPSDDLPYPIFVYLGVLPWTFFSTAVTAAGNSVVGSAAADHQDLLPTPGHPLCIGGRGLVDLAIAFVPAHRSDVLTIESFPAGKCCWSAPYRPMAALMRSVWALCWPP